jgi:hypothetical protein
VERDVSDLLTSVLANAFEDVTQLAYITAFENITTPENGHRFMVDLLAGPGNG